MDQHLKIHPFLLVALLLFFLQGCATSPLLLLGPDKTPLLHDDLNRRDLVQAVDRSLEYLQSRPPEATFAMADQEVTNRRLISSLQRFKKLLQDGLSDQELQAALEKYFFLFQAAGTRGPNPGRTMLVTGYYQPVVQGSLQQHPPYLYPLYRVPPDLVVRPASDDGKPRVGRMEGTDFRPYWTRKEIELWGKAAGSELVWLKDPLDVFFLQIQGSGYIALEDGTLHGVGFAAKNGHPYHSIGKYMVQTGKMSRDEASMATIRSYISSHPQESNEILFSNPSYIFFQWQKRPGAVGNLDRQLTAGRSIAADQTCFPAGGLAFLKSRIPVIQHGRIVSWKTMHRFVLVQDSGSAIRGPGRVDLFMGAGEAAGAMAGSMKEQGTLYFLVLKEDTP